jgi:hypothetical protein
MRRVFTAPYQHAASMLFFPFGDKLAACRYEEKTSWQLVGTSGMLA